MIQRKIEENRQRAMSNRGNRNAIGKNHTGSSKMHPALSSPYFYIVANAEKDKDVRSKLLNYLHTQGFNSPKLEEAPMLLAKAVKQRGKQGLYDLANLHPDREVIINQYLLSKGVVKDSSYDSACGCSYATTGMSYNADEDRESKPDNISDIEAELSKKRLQTANVIIVGSIALTGIAILSLIASRSLK